MDLRVRTWTGYRGSAIRDARDRAGRGGATRSVRQSATDTVREDSDRDAFGSRAGGDGRTWRCRRSAPRAPPWEWRWQTCALDWDGRRAVQRPAIVPEPRLEGPTSKHTVGSVGTRGFDFGALRLFIRRGRERKRYLPRHGREPKKRRIKPPYKSEIQKPPRSQTEPNRTKRSQMEPVTDASMICLWVRNSRILTIRGRFRSPKRRLLSIRINSEKLTELPDWEKLNPESGVRDSNGAKRSQTEPNEAHRDPLGGVQTPSMGGGRQKKFGKTPDMGPQDPLWRSFVVRHVHHGRSTEAMESSARRPSGSVVVWKLPPLPRVARVPAAGRVAPRERGERRSISPRDVDDVARARFPPPYRA